jgi:muramoyltetrapeptide carboxypeptidase LdcA involved in peptidoglycan recycling
LHNFLWNLGIPSYYGSAIMTQLAFQGQMNEMTINSLNHALFDEGEYELEVAKQYCDVGLDWSDKDNLTKTRKMEPNDGLIWNGNTDVEGILWGGCVESLIVQSTTAKYLPKNDDLEGTILFIETAEDIPDPWIVDYLLTGFGERGWFDTFQAVLVGRPKAWEFDKQNTTEVKAEYRKLQRETIVTTVREYNKIIPVVQNLDFGHTDPQVALPMGKTVKIQGSTQKILLEY